MKCLLSVVVVLFCLSVNGQDSLLIGNQAFNTIYEAEGPLYFSFRSNKNYIVLKQEEFFKNHSQSLLKDKKDFYIRIDGTGRVYKVKEKKGDTLFIKRIDSTYFFGYNGYSYDFFYKDTIMSLGGFGFWRKNGQLRFYSHQNHEWDIITLNEEIPASRECVYYDTSLSQIYWLKTPHIDAATNTEDKDVLVYQLDLATRKNVLLGELNPELSAFFPIRTQYISLQVPSLNGQLVTLDGGKIFLFDFVNNEVFQLTNPAIEKTIFSSSVGNYIDLAFEKNGKLFFTQSNDTSHQLDSITISRNDFIKMKSPLYLSKNQYNRLYYLIGALLFFGLVIFIYRRIKLKDKNAASQQQSTISDGSEYQFKQIELDLIEKIYQVSLSGKSYSVEDVNNVLGLTKKSLEIQKKIRTETLNRINHRFKMKFETDEDLIERIRSEEDRRFYRYIIREENGKKALGI